MNILTSYNWIKEYLDTDLAPEEFARLTTGSGNSVEYAHDLAKTYENMVVGEVLEVKPHPDADKLRIAMTNVGTETVQIVCGGENLAEGQKVVVALPGAWVKWHGEGEPVELKKTKIRGQESVGMICAVEEVGFEKLAHGGKDIWDITSLTDAKAGTPIADALDLNDVIFDIEVTTNRPDCKSVIGQAREGGAVTRAEFTWKPAELPAIPAGAAALSVSVEDAELCEKYEAIRIDGVSVQPSPWWLQKKLLLAGLKPINNIVDITNYILHEYGQPMHAFDADKIQGGEVHVRRANAGEKIAALDGETHELTENMLVIADARAPIAIAGVIGGMESGTGEETTSILLESATFNPVSTRRTARALNIQTDSSLLFEKGLSTESTTPALARAVQLVLELAGGTIASDVFTYESVPYAPLSFAFDPERAAELIHADLSEHDMLGILHRLGFQSSLKKGKKYSMAVPYWRDHDIEDSIDFVEEIARVYGYDRIPSILPVGELAPAERDPMILWERRAKEVLRGAGLSEAYSYAFVSRQQLSAYGIAESEAVAIHNPLSSDHSHMRPSLVPSMMSTIAVNHREIPEAALFEIAPVYEPQKEEIPTHRMRLLVAVYGKDGGMTFRKAKGILLRLAREMGIRTLRLERNVADARLHGGRSASVWLGEHEHAGIIGEVSPQVAEAFDVDARTVIVELDFELMVAHARTAKSYHAIPQFPEVKRDLAVVVSERVEYAELEYKLKETSGLIREVELFDIYRGKGVDEGKKSLAMHLSFRAEGRTLESDEVDVEMARLRKMLETAFNATMRS